MTRLFRAIRRLFERPVEIKPPKERVVENLYVDITRRTC